jgi:hypothetical protein
VTDFKTVTIDHSDTPPEAKLRDIVYITDIFSVKLALFFGDTPGSSTSSNNAIASSCILSIIWLQVSIVKATEA